MQGRYYNVDMINLRIEFVEPRSGNLQGDGVIDYYFGSADNHGMAKGPPNPAVSLADYVDLCDSVVGHSANIFVLFHEVAHIEDFSGGEHGGLCSPVIPTGATETGPYAERPSEVYANCRGAEVLNQYNSELDLADHLAGYG